MADVHFATLEHDLALVRVLGLVALVVAWPVRAALADGRTRNLRSLCRTARSLLPRRFIGMRSSKRMSALSRRARSAAVTRLAGALSVPFVASCAGSIPPPAFDGHESPTWLAYSLDVPGHDASDLLPAFEASARAFGCMTEHLQGRTYETISNGELRAWYGVQAVCGDDGTIALLMLVKERAEIGCERPSTRGRCDALLEKITSAR